jgi:hypothetical protein
MYYLVMIMNILIMTHLFYYIYIYILIKQIVKPDT